MPGLIRAAYIQNKGAQKKTTQFEDQMKLNSFRPLHLRLYKSNQTRTIKTNWASGVDVSCELQMAQVFLYITV